MNAYEKPFPFTISELESINPLGIPPIPFLEPKQGEFITQDTIDWVANHWNIAWIAVISYVIIIFGLKYFILPGTKPFILKGPLALWNLLLALFSIYGAIKVVPALFYLLYKQGLWISVCGHPDLELAPIYYSIVGYWSFIFALSKIPEMIDTLFIVLRQKYLMFLHWYHHITVMLYCWLAWAEASPNGAFFASMNLTVHAFMYSYYFLSTLGINPIPGIFVTIIQIIQMILGVLITLATGYFYFSPSHGCMITPLVIYSGLIMYLSYLVLFVLFFIDRWIRPKKKSSQKKKDNKKKE